MIAATTNFKEAERRARDQRKVDLLLVTLTAIGAVAVGLAINAMNGVDFFGGGLVG